MYMFRKIRAFYQRGKRGFADSDIWCFDSYLSRVIWKGLKQLKNCQNGYPVTKDPDKYSAEELEEAWTEILDKVIKGFKQYDEEDEGEWWEDSPPYWKTDDWKEAKGLFIKWFETFWD